MNLIDARTIIIFCIVGVQTKPAREITDLCDNKTNIDKSFKCKPRKVFVNILPDFKVRPKIAGSVVQVKRCIGFDGIQRCVPTKTVNVTVKVRQGGKCQRFLVEQHTKCKYELVEVKPKRPECLQGTSWNEETSKCECYRECTTGSYFDTKSCSCLQRAH